MALFTVNGRLSEFLPVGVSQLGTAVHDNVVFPSGQYTDLEGNLQTYSEVTLNAVKVRIDSAGKEVVLSNVAGQAGTNKEYVAANDITFTITAIISPDLYSPESLASVVAARAGQAARVAQGLGLRPETAPYEPMRQIARLNKVAATVDIRCKYLQQVWEVDKCVILDTQSRQLSADTWEFSINCISDIGLDLESFVGLEASQLDAISVITSLV